MYDMSIRKRAAALITAAAITASFAGCADTSYVMKADDETINAGIYIDYMFSAMQQQLYMWQYTGVTENYFDQKVDDKDFATYLLDEAMDKTKRYAAVEKLFKDSGLKISSDDMKEINNSISDTWEGYSKLYESEGISKDSLKKVAVNAKKEEMLFDYFYGKEGKEAASKDELMNYMNSSYIRFKGITIYKSTNEDEVKKQEENDKNKELFDKYSEKAKDVKFADFDALIDEYNAETAPEDEDDTAADDGTADADTADTDVSGTDESTADDSSKDDASSADDASSQDESTADADSSEKEVTESVSSFEAENEDSSVVDDTSVADDSSAADDSTVTDDSAADGSSDDASDAGTIDITSDDITDITDADEADAEEAEPDPYANERLINFSNLDEETLEGDYGKRLQAVKDADIDGIVTYEDDNAYYIMSKGDITLRSSEYLDDETNYDTILHEAKDKDFDAKIKEVQDKIVFSENKDAIDRYLPKTVYEKYNEFLNKNSDSKKAAS